MTSLITSFKLPEKIHQEVLKKVVFDGYGIRGKSKWIVEAIENLLARSYYPELVDIAGETNEKGLTVSIRVPEKLMNQIDKAVLDTRKIYPTMEGVRSNIFRAGIMQRLLTFSH